MFIFLKADKILYFGNGMGRDQLKHTCSLSCILKYPHAPLNYSQPFPVHPLTFAQVVAINSQYERTTARQSILGKISKISSNCTFL